MKQPQTASRFLHLLVVCVLALIGLLAMPPAVAFAQKPETIEAAAMGTGTQLGANVEVRLVINEFSSEQDRQILIKAFEQSQNQGLVNALSRMRAVGHLSLAGTLGYDCSFIRLIRTPTGRSIRFVTNRPIRFGEVWWGTQSQSFNLSAGEININDQDKNKSTGLLFPAAMLTIDKQGQLQLDLNQNAWKLVDILDWAGTPGVN
ncbi:MAG TPA: hypothetical protein VEJ67_05890 [Candidatus Cybelea sp.]|nr:hypothetical protein [Candidatus Cybelea sp.]